MATTVTTETIRLDTLTSKTRKVNKDEAGLLSYAPSIEVLETAPVDALCVKDIIVPAFRRRDVLRIIWTDASIEGKQKQRGMPFMPKEQMKHVQTLRQTTPSGVSQMLKRLITK